MRLPSTFICSVYSFLVTCGGARTRSQSRPVLQEYADVLASTSCCRGLLRCSVAAYSFASVFNTES